MLRPCFIALLCLFSAGAQAASAGSEAPAAEQSAAEEQVAERREALNQAAGELPEGRFEVLTEKLFPIERTHLGGDITLKGLSEWERRLSRERGFDYAFVNAPIGQIGSVDGETYADNEMDLYLQWRVQENATVTSRLFFWGTYVQTFSSQPNGEFSRSQQLLTSTISAGTDPKQHFTAPSALWWEQAFHQTGFTYRTGQLYATSLWGNNRYTADDREGFMNSVLSSNVGLPWSDRPRGIGAMVKQALGFGYVAAGFQDAKGDQDRIDASSFLDGRFLYTLEVGLTPGLNTDGEGRYTLAVGYMDTDPGEQQSSWGLAISARRELGPQLGLFGQVRHTFGNRVAADIRTSANLGVVFNAPFGWVDDSLGIGLLYARPESAELRDEFGLEVYWRLQLTHRLDVTPDLQIIRPRARGSNGTSVVGGLRLRYIL
jgi:hypothetical protein